jgi:hypothetical protein
MQTATSACRTAAAHNIQDKVITIQNHITRHCKTTLISFIVIACRAAASNTSGATEKQQQHGNVYLATGTASLAALKPY